MYQNWRKLKISQKLQPLEHKHKKFIIFWRSRIGAHFTSWVWNLLWQSSESYGNSLISSSLVITTLWYWRTITVTQYSTIDEAMRDRWARCEDERQLTCRTAPFSCTHVSCRGYLQTWWASEHCQPTQHRSDW